jgi:ABC-type multidrug transport system ATPase subunit
LTNEILPTEGTITVKGKDVTKEFETIRHKLGYCPQSDALFNGVTVREHLKFYAEIKGIPPHMQDKLVQE